MKVPGLGVLPFAVLHDGDAPSQLLEVYFEAVLLWDLTIEVVGGLAQCAVVELQKTGG